MPAFAPRRSILAEKERAQAARDERDGMRITLGGRSYPQAEVFLGGIKIESHADGSGFRLAQRIVVKIRKALLRPRHLGTRCSPSPPPAAPPASTSPSSKPPAKAPARSPTSSKPSASPRPRKSKIINHKS